MAKTGEFVSRYLREIVFGLEDSVVSTLGAVSGIAVGSGAASTVVMAGFVIITVEAISMAAGSYLSAQAASEAFRARAEQDAIRVLAEKVSDTEALRDVLHRKHFSKKEVAEVARVVTRERRLWLREMMRGEYRLAATVTEVPLIAGMIMGFFYAVGGALIMVPYLALPLTTAFYVALGIGAASMVFLGWVKSVLTGVRVGRSVGEMVGVSGVAAAIGVIVGRFCSLQ